MKQRQQATCKWPQCYASLIKEYQAFNLLSFNHVSFLSFSDNCNINTISNPQTDDQKFLLMSFLDSVALYKWEKAKEKTGVQELWISLPFKVWGKYEKMYNCMAWCKIGLSDFLGWNVFSFRSAWIFACAFQFSSKMFSYSFCWNALVPLCCVHCAHFDILSSFFSEKSVNQPKKYRGMFYYLIKKNMEKFRHFWRKKNSPNKVT